MNISPGDFSPPGCFFLLKQATLPPSSMFTTRQSSLCSAEKDNRQEQQERCALLWWLSTHPPVDVRNRWLLDPAVVKFVALSAKDCKGVCGKVREECVFCLPLHLFLSLGLFFGHAFLRALLTGVYEFESISSSTRLVLYDQEG